MSPNPRPLILAVLLPLAAFAQKPLPESVTLAVGATQVLDCEGVMRLSVGDSAIVDVKPLDDMKLEVIGAGDGETTITVWLAGVKEPKTIRAVVGRGGPAKPVASEPRIRLRPEYQKLLTPGGKVLKVAIGDPAIGEVKPVGNDLLLVIGKDVGETPLKVWLADGTQKSYLVVVAR